MGELRFLVMAPLMDGDSVRKYDKEKIRVEGIHAHWFRNGLEMGELEFPVLESDLGVKS